MPAELSSAVRFVTSSSLFDGHDASINIMRRVLQSQGCEVIHLGHNRSAHEIVQAAIQEDAHGIAISSYQGGHVEFFRYVIDLLKEGRASHIRVFGGGGGTITPSEAEALHQYGVARIFSPEDGRKMGLEGMIRFMIEACAERGLSHIQWDELKHFSENPFALAQALTLVEEGEAAKRETRFEQARHALFAPHSSRAFDSPWIVGLTGTGGAGKSSLTDELILRTLEKDSKARVAVLAVDPTRRRTGGALLGDRLRMNSLYDTRCYMRSFATREANSSVSAAVREALVVLKNAGFDWIFLETGGIGQADSSIVGLCDVHLYVMTSEFGAPTQLEKINMLDYADVVVLNKFEKPGSLDALTDVRKQFRRNHREFEKLPSDQYPVFATIASRFADPGVDAVFEHLLRIRSSEKKRIPLSTPHRPEQFSRKPLVPRERLNYLSEIAMGVRNYKRDVIAACEKLSELEAIQKTALLTGLKKETRTELEEQTQSILETLPASLIEELEKFEKLAKSYEGDSLSYEVRERSIDVPLTARSLSDTPIRKVTPPRFRSRSETLRFLLMENLPGYFPFTAGVFPFKRTEEDPKRQFAGEGTPARTNKRFHLLCEGEKAKRLSTAFDSVTLYGEDPQRRPDIYGKIGESGVSICTLENAKRLYQGFDLCDPTTSVSMTINGPAPVLLAFFFNTAIDQQIEQFTSREKRLPTDAERKRLVAETLSTVRGTVQADILKEDQAQNTCIFSTEFALRMMGDMQQFFVDHSIRNYYSVSISGYHIAEAGANPITQLAFTLANGLTYVEYYLARGMAVDDFAANFSFFFSNALDPEYTVIGRVARRIWALAMKYRYGANERSQKLKYHIQTSGRSLHAQEIAFNDIRTTLQALLAYFDQCNSLHTNAYDEAVTTPTEESVRRAMAIQLILTKELGWAKSENPLQGSFFVEELTELVEEAVLQEFERLSARGGVLGAMETHYQRSKIQEESLTYETLKHSGGLPIVGVNTFVNPGKGMAEFSPGDLTRASYAEKDEQIEHVQDFQRRHASESADALARLRAAARTTENLFAVLMDVARVCSLGQISQALYEVGGKYRRGA